MFRKILIAVDGSSCSERAGKVGLALASRLNSLVVVAHVQKHPTAYLGLTIPSEDVLQQVQTILQPWETLGQQMQLKLHTETAHSDDVAEGIVHLANLGGIVHLANLGACDLNCPEEPWAQGSGTAVIG